VHVHVHVRMHLQMRTRMRTRQQVQMQAAPMEQRHPFFAATVLHEEDETSRTPCLPPIHWVLAGLGGVPAVGRLQAMVRNLASPGGVPAVGRLQAMAQHAGCTATQARSVPSFLAFSRYNVYNLLSRMVTRVRGVFCSRNTASVNSRTEYNDCIICHGQH